MSTMPRLFAALALAGGSLMAQSTNLEMSVPFAFTVPGANLPAGAYTVNLGSEINRVQLTHEATGRSVFVMTPVPGYATGGKPTNGAHVTFQCLGERCTLTQVWPKGAVYGRATLARSAPRPAAGRADSGTIRVALK